jgi:hypothetical protein
VLFEHNNLSQCQLLRDYKECETVLLFNNNTSKMALNSLQPMCKYMTRYCTICFKNYEGDRYEHIRIHTTDFDSVAKYLTSLETRIEALEGKKG